MYRSILSCPVNFIYWADLEILKCPLCVTVSRNCQVSMVLLFTCRLVAFYLCIAMKYITRILTLTPFCECMEIAYTKLSYFVFLLYFIFEQKIESPK